MFQIDMNYLPYNLTNKSFIFIFFLNKNIYRVEYQKDTKSQNTGSFIIQKEDHTLGNVLTM